MEDQARKPTQGVHCGRQPDARRGARTGPAAHRRVVRRRPRPDRRATETFGSDHRDPVRLRASPARRRSSTCTAPSVREITLNGQALDPASYDADKGRIPLPRLAAEQRAARGGRLRLLPHRRGPAPLRRPGRRQRLPVHAVRDVPTRTAMYACFDQPDLKATFALDRDARPRTGRSSPTTAAETGRRAGRVWHFPPTPRDLHLHHRARRRARTTSCATSTARRRPVIPLGVFCRAVARRAPRRRRDLRGHQAGVRLLREGLRPPVPVRQVRPALRARVQRGRDGERRAA